MRFPSPCGRDCEIWQFIFERGSESKRERVGDLDRRICAACGSCAALADQARFSIGFERFPFRLLTVFHRFHGF
jgi:hypothetical protein